MSNTVDFITNSLQKTIEKILGWWAFVIIACHILLAAFCYVIPYRNFTPFLRWAGLGLLIIALIYLAYSIIASNASRKRIFFFFKRVITFEQILLLVLLFLACVSCYVNGNRLSHLSLLFAAHDWELFDLVICFLLIFPMTKIVGKEHAKTVIEMLIHITVVTYTAFAVVCLWHIWHLEVLNLPSGEQAGITSEVQLMLGLHYNLTGMISISMFCLCIYILFSSKDVFTRILYILFTLVHVVIVYLSNSRAVFIGFLVFTVFLTFTGTWIFSRAKKKYLRGVYSLILAAIIGGLVWIGRPLVFTLFERITHFSESLATESGWLTFSSRAYSATALSTSQATSCSPLFLVASGKESVRQLTDLNNRSKIWLAAFRVMVADTSTFFFGKTTVGVTDALKGIGNYPFDVAHAHNVILQVGVSNGVPAMAVFLLFLVNIAIKCLRFLFISKTQLELDKVILTSTILCFTVINMAEPYIFGYFSVMACFYYLLCGYINSDSETVSSIPIRKRRGLTILYIFIVFTVVGTSFFVGNYLSGTFVKYRENLLFGVNRGTNNFTLLDNGYDAKLISDGKGVKVTIGKHPDSGWLVLTFNDDVSRKLLSSPIGDVYTLSFEAKSNFAGTKIIASHRQRDSHKNQITFGTAIIQQPDTWISFSLTGTLRNIPATSQVLYIDLGDNAAKTEVSIRNMKLEKTDISATDNLLYGTNFGVTNFSLVEKGFGAILENDGLGVKITTSSRDDSGWLVLFFNDGNSCELLSGPAGVSYTISFEAKSSFPNTVVHVSHRQADWQENQIDFGTAVLPAANQWENFSLTGTLVGTKPTSQGVFFGISSVPENTEINIRNLRLNITK